MKPLRVLMTADAVGGVWTYALDLARALAAYGVQFTIATMGALPSAQQEAEAAVSPNVQLAASACKLEWMPEPWDDIERSGEWLMKLAKETSADIIHMNGYAHGTLPFDAPKLIVAHSCVLSWWQAVKGEAAPVDEWARYKEAVEAGLRSADLVVAPTAAMLDALHAQYAFSKPERVVYNGRDGSAFNAAEAKEPLILCAGRLWDEAKNVATLAEIAGELDWPVLVVGDAAHPSGAAAEFAGVRMLGRLSPAEMAGQMSRAAIYCLPARYEPFGLSALEAGLSGCALVLGDIPSLREVWSDAACFVDPEDHIALRDTVNELLRDEAKRSEMARRASKRAEQFTLEKMGQGTMEIYRELLNGRLGANGDAA